MMDLFGSKKNRAGLSLCQNKHGEFSEILSLRVVFINKRLRWLFTVKLGSDRLDT